MTNSSVSEGNIRAATRLRRHVAAALLLVAPFLSAGARAAEDALPTAVFAAGCFWCVEEAFDKVEGVVETVSGYAGGTHPDPSYEQVSRGWTGHAEVVRVRYDPARVDYARLLDTFWHNVDPVDGGGQFCDRGSQYRGAVFVGSDAERRLAEDSKADLAKRLGQAVAVEIAPAATFYPAEDYHQNYYQTNPVRYRYYKWQCGREQRLEEVWGKKGS
jgi:peptide-methionine (S)-S-oxide reductase